MSVLVAALTSFLFLNVEFFLNCRAYCMSVTLSPFVSFSEGGGCEFVSMSSVLR